MKATYRIIKKDDNYIIRRAEKLNQYGGRDYKYFGGYGSMGINVYWEDTIENVGLKMGLDEATAVMHDLMNIE